MNATNRGLNRTLTVILGLIAFAVGAALVAVVAAPAIRGAYGDNASTVHGAVTGWFRSTMIPGTGTSWGWVAVLAVLALIVVLLVIFIARQGHGHHDVVFREGTSAAGSTIIDAAVAQEAIQHDLDGREEFIGSHVSTYRVRKTPVLKISVTCRRGVSPREVTETIEGSLRALDRLLGVEIPALIQISGGFRARMLSATRT
jgi:hypothetical protein